MFLISKVLCVQKKETVVSRNSKTSLNEFSARLMIEYRLHMCTYAGNLLINWRSLLAALL